MNELLYSTWLCNINTIGYETVMKLYETFGSSRAVFKADAKALKGIPGITENEITQLMNKNTGKTDKILSDCEKHGIKILCCFDDGYPKMLRTIQNPPKLLYIKGCKMDFNNLVTVTVVGSRRPSEYGARMAFRLGYDLAKEGVTIVSGMARGIDGLSQRGALKAGGKTIAVLGTGCDITYPPENKELKSIIESNGCVVSEYPPGTKGLPGNFPRRNRIMSGMAMAVIIVEGAKSSGTSITANLAAEQGRDLYCLPGNVDNPLSYIPNSYIKDGCPVITSAEDVIIGLSASYPEMMLQKVLTENSEKTSNNNRLNDVQQKIVSTLSKNTPIHLDEICAKTSLDAAVVNQNILLLEISGVVSSMPGKNYILR